MIHALLKRIANRGPAHDRSALPSTTSSSGVSDPFNVAYPVRIKRNSPGVLEAHNPWLDAADAAMQARSEGGPIADQPALFAHWGIAHVALARLVWAERRSLGAAAVHIVQGSKVLAAVLPAARRIWVQTTVYEPEGEVLRLQLTQHGKADDNELLRKGFKAHSLPTLMWFYGQADGAAPALLPAEMGEHLIELRRFPQVEPAALAMRHLALIHLFSSGALRFARLRDMVSLAHQSSLCADLTSLYLTGALQLRDSESQPPEK